MDAVDVQRTEDALAKSHRVDGVVCGDAAPFAHAVRHGQEEDNDGQLLSNTGTESGRGRESAPKKGSWQDAGRLSRNLCIPCAPHMERCARYPGVGREP